MSKEIIGVVKDWHDPRNNTCQHNEDVAQNCNCKRPQKRKPFRCVRVRDTDAGHGIKPDLIFEIYSDGTVAMREKRRKKRFYITAGRIYHILLQREAFASVAKRKRRKR